MYEMTSHSAATRVLLLLYGERVFGIIPVYELQESMDRCKPMKEWLHGLYDR